jgi:type I restriction enzyme R subunit
MAKNEAETRYELIDPLLRDKGYRIPYVRLETPAPVEPIGPKGRRRKGPGKTDYLLCVEVPGGPKPLPVAILEAKKEDEDPLKGMQQAKGYSECERFDAKYIFSTNGHLYAKFNKFTGEQTGPFPFVDFPDHPRLTDCYHRHTGIKLDEPSALLLFQPDSPAYPEPRYYQDAAIRAAFEKILQSDAKGDVARILLSLATGSGKTIIAANLLWRLHEAERLPKPALFLCDRDELRGQAYTKLKAVFGDNARIVETKNGENAAKNARIHIATYQTLGLDDADADFASFLSEHYAVDAFSVIIIDECHRSAWGRWSEVLRRNPNAIHIGLTATPRQLRVSKTATEEDAEITANNHKYFGEPVYEYTLTEAQEDGFFTLSQVYEDLLLKMGEKNSDGGAFFTPREVIRAMVHTLQPQLGDTIYDPCCGTGGFLAVAYEHIARSLGNAPASTDIDTLKHDTFFGREKDNIAFPIALANLVLHGIDQPNLWHGNTLTKRGTYAALFDKAPKFFNVILTNPPFGGKEGKDAQKNYAYATGSTQVLFVQDIQSISDQGEIVTRALEILRTLLRV